ncbi:MAG: hypothetical protein VXY66_00495 [Pseudomonadota bacterium]|nr:hypothetical protein [Pseudomonadota bacterium]
MAFSQELRSLIDTSSKLWAGEAEVVRTYWTSPVRTLETDLLWIRRQCSKEFNGSGIGEYKNMGVFMGPLTELKEIFGKIDTGEEDSVSRHYVLELIDTLKDEYEHFCLFSDVYDQIKPNNLPSINPHKLETWDEDVALTRLRHSHIAEHGQLGVRASRFTEGGYCTLFREGMRAADLGGQFAPSNKIIAAACKEIYEDEFGHMLEGIAGLGREGWSAEEFKLMEELVVSQLRHRVLMRNAEFSFPLSEERILAIFGGEIEPEPFDYIAAESHLALEAAE